MSVTIGGTYSGLNVSSIISAVIAADAIPITNLQTTDTTLQSQSTDLGAVGTSLGQLSTVLQTLGSPSLFSSQAATSSVPTVGSVTVDSTAQSGTTSIDITQLATTTVLRGGSATGAYTDTKLTAPPADSTLVATALNETSVDGQKFTINGKQITLAQTDTLSDLIGKINDSGAGVNAAYDSTTGDVSLTSTSDPATPILLGSAADTSDFLQQAELFNNGTSSVTSSVGLGRVDPTADLSTAGLRTTPTTGTFSINGVSINYAAGDTLNTLISKINTSSAGVTAVYDSYEDQLVLSSTQRGPQNITVADGTSNMATALRLTTSDSSLQAGQATLFTVNGSSTVRQSDSNIISAAEIGVPGITFTASGTGTTDITVSPDVTSIANAINAFVTQYNSTQATINQYTAIDTSDTTKNGALASDTNLTFLAPELRSVTDAASGSATVVRMLSDLGVDSNANDNTLTDVDTAKLQDALTNHLSDVQSLFDDAASGLTNTIQTVVDGYNDSLNGVITNEQNEIAQQISYNKDQISQMQTNLQNEQTNLENEFAALDSVIAQGEGISSIFNGSSGSGATASTSSSSSSFGNVGSSTTSGNSTSSSSSS